LAESEIKKYREKIDKMKDFILEYGLMPALMYALQNRQEQNIFIMAYVELQNEGKIS